MNKKIRPTPWDAKVLGVKSYELNFPSERELRRSAALKGHVTVKLDPLASKKRLHALGFYYCDTLAEPVCSRERFISFPDPEVTVSSKAPLDALLGISHGAFRHGRFHRDFSVTRAQADRRYDNWLRQLHRTDRVLAVYHRKKLAGFVGVEKNKIVLNALGRSYRERGLGKRLMSAACRALFDRGYSNITSSISMAQSRAVNLYASLGFRFRRPDDVYHRLLR